MFLSREASSKILRKSVKPLAGATSWFWPREISVDVAQGNDLHEVARVVDVARALAADADAGDAELAVGVLHAGRGTAGARWKIAERGGGCGEHLRRLIRRAMREVSVSGTGRSACPEGTKESVNATRGRGNEERGRYSLRRAGRLWSPSRAITNRHRRATRHRRHSTHGEARDASPLPHSGGRRRASGPVHDPDQPPGRRGHVAVQQPAPCTTQEKYGFEPTDKWLDHVRLSCVRFNSGGSGSFVSPDGLVMTNHHVGADDLAKLSDDEEELPPRRLPRQDPRPRRSSARGWN